MGNAPMRRGMGGGGRYYELDCEFEDLLSFLYFRNLSAQSLHRSGVQFASRCWLGHPQQLTSHQSEHYRNSQCYRLKRSRRGVICPSTSAFPFPLRENEQGIKLSRRPPGMSWKQIDNLNGREKTLIRLSFVIALHQFKPSPFSIMDKIDAVLDSRNVSIIEHYFRAWTTNAD